MSDHADKTEFRIAHPVQAHGEMVSVLYLRRPTAGDLTRAGGRPLRIKNMAEVAEAAERARNGIPGEAVGPDIEYFYEKLNALVSRIAQVPVSTVEALTWGDYERLQQEISGFFLRSLQESGEAAENSAASSIRANGSTGVSTSPTSGNANPPSSLTLAGRN